MEIVSRTAEEVFIPLTVGGGVVLGRGRRPAAARRRRQGRGQHRRDPPARAGRRDRRPVRQPGAGALRRRAARAPGTDSGFEVTTHGGRKSAGLDAIEWAVRAAELGAGEILLNAMDADGTQDGFDLELIRAVRREVTIPVIASGGAGRRRALRRRPSTPARTPCWPRPSSTSARCGSATSSRRSPPPATRCAERSALGVSRVSVGPRRCAEIDMRCARGRCAMRPCVAVGTARAAGQVARAAASRRPRCCMTSTTATPDAATRYGARPHSPASADVRPARPEVGCRTAATASSGPSKVSPRAASRPKRKRISSTTSR